MKPPAIFHIVLDSQHFEITNQNTRECVVIKWSDVELITAYKRDLWAYDCICVEFQLLNGPQYEVDEEMDGFEHLMQEVPKYCPGCVPYENWFFDIMVPAFETKMTQLYRRLPMTAGASPDSHNTLDYRGPQ